MEKYRELITSRARMFTLTLIKCLKEIFNDIEVYNDTLLKIRIQYQDKYVYISYENLEMYANNYELGTLALYEIKEFFITGEY